VIERAYEWGERWGLAVCCEDEAGPYQTVPYAGGRWQPTGEPLRYPHEYFREGTAKMLTLFHPASGEVRVKGVTSSPNAVLHPWLKSELSAIVAQLPPVLEGGRVGENRPEWDSWQAGLTVKPSLSAELPPLRMLLVLDNLAGHKTADFVLWLFSQGILPLYTPLGGSGLNMAESIQRILKRRALDGQYPLDVATIIGWLEATARGWNAHPTPFVWGGKRQARRQRARQRKLHPLGGSGACSRHPLRRFLNYGVPHAK